MILPNVTFYVKIKIKKNCNSERCFKGTQQVLFNRFMIYREIRLLLLLYLFLCSACSSFQNQLANKCVYFIISRWMHQFPKLKISRNSLLLRFPIQFSPVATVISAKAFFLLIISLIFSSKVLLVIKR